MKITISKKSLVAALAIVKSAAGGRTTLPILSHVLIEATGKSVKFACTDLDRFIQVRVEATIEAKGSTTVRAHLLYDIVNAVPAADAEITLELVKHLVRITSGQAKYQLGVLPAEDFVPFPSFKAAASLRLTQAQLRELLYTTVAPAKSADESRYVLCGTYLESNAKHDLTAVATDGRRLQKHTITVDKEGNDGEPLPKLALVLPRVTVTELLRLLAVDEERSVDINVTDNQVSFKFTTPLGDEAELEINLVSKVIEGNYPNYQQVIPDEDSQVKGIRVTLGRADLLSVVQRVRVIGTILQLEGNQQTLTIATTSEAKDMPGDAEERLLIPKTKAFKYALQATFLTDALSAITDDEVMLCHTGRQSPLIIKSVTRPWLCVIMGYQPQEDPAVAETAETKPK